MPPTKLPLRHIGEKRQNPGTLGKAVCRSFGVLDGIDDFAGYFNVSLWEVAGYAPRRNTMQILSISERGSVATA